jgi:pimeloyl-ACP methyl ester carboxylesterase
MMRFEPDGRRVAFIGVALSIALTACNANGGEGGAVLPSLATRASASPAKAVSCKDLTTLRAAHSQIRVVKNPSTKDSMEYLVAGDGAAGKDVLLFFPGTGQTIAGWPIQLITNAKYSPKIVKTTGYRPTQNATVSLCHNYRLVFVDYPGVGETPVNSNLTHDDVSSDADFVLNDVQSAFKIDTSVVDPVGWSLGTEMALKYSVLSPVSEPSRKIHDVVLIATGPGGSIQGDETHDSAECVKNLFNASVQYKGLFDDRIKVDLAKLIFPYQGQHLYNNGTRSDCTATVTPSVIDLSVTTVCDESNNCKPYYDSVVASNKTYPWILTDGIGRKIYPIERELANDWYEAYCGAAAPGFHSVDCHVYGTIDINKNNGGVCKTDTANLDDPVTLRCAHISLTGKITVLNAYEDLFDQWTYGRAVVDGYNRDQGAGTAALFTFKAPAGHGLMIQHPAWTQEHINAAI